MRSFEIIEYEIEVYLRKTWTGDSEFLTFYCYYVLYYFIIELIKYWS